MPSKKPAKKAVPILPVPTHDPHTKEALTDMMVHASRHEQARALDADHSLQQGKEIHTTLDHTLEQHTRTHDAIKDNGQSIDDMHEGLTDKLDEVKDTIGQVGDKLAESLKPKDEPKTIIILPMPGRKGDKGETPTKEEMNAAIEELLPEAVRKVQPGIEELLQMVKDSLAEEQSEEGEDAPEITDDHIIELIKRTVPELKIIKNVHNEIKKFPTIVQIADSLKGKFKYDDLKDKPNLDTYTGKKLGGSGYLKDISDVDTTGLQVGQALIWNGRKWVPAAVGGVGGGYTYVEVPTGAVNGSNTVFTLAHIPTQPSLMLVNLNGAIQTQIGGTPDYTVTSNTITFTTPPYSGTLIVYYS